MVTWTESHDRYTLKAAEWEWALLYALVGVAGLLLTVQMRTACLMPFCGILSLVFLILAVYSLPVAWVEVPLQGGAVRWGVGGQAETTEPVRVDRFEVDPVMRALRHGDPNRYTVVAVLPDGRRHRVLGRWDCFPPDRAQALAAQLNGILGREERPPLLDEICAARASRERTMTGCVIVLLLGCLFLALFGRGC